MRSGYNSATPSSDKGCPPIIAGSPDNTPVCLLNANRFQNKCVVRPGVGPMGLKVQGSLLRHLCASASALK